MNNLMKQFIDISGLNDDNPSYDKFSDSYTWVHKHEYGDWLEKRIAEQSKLITDMMEWMEEIYVIANGMGETNEQRTRKDLIQRAKDIKDR